MLFVWGLLKDTDTGYLHGTD